MPRLAAAGLRPSTSRNFARASAREAVTQNIQDGGEAGDARRLPERYRDRARREAAADRGGGRAARHPGRRALPLRAIQGQAEPRLRRLPRGPAGRQAHPGDRDQPHAGGRRQDDDDGGLRRRAQPSRQARRHLHSRAEPRPLLRREGRGGRRRPLAGRAHGGHQPPFHRRFPCHRRRQQPARRHDRQSRLLGQQARYRRAAHQPGGAWST